MTLKEAVAKAALSYIDDDMIVGVGTGSTVNYFIDQLATIKHRINACVASSHATAIRLKALGIQVFDLNTVPEVSLYVDGADEVTLNKQMIKGGGGALTREKIIATVAQHFICIVDETKLVPYLGSFPIAVEVIPMARGFVARELVKLGGNPKYREGITTDNGNILLDLYNMEVTQPQHLEDSIKLIPGVVENGLFAHRCADKVLIANPLGIQTIS